MSDLSQIKEVLLVYGSQKKVNNRIKITHNIICDVDNIVENIEVLRKIVASLEIKKAEYALKNINFEYTIKSINKIKQELSKKNSKTIKELKESILIYSKDNSYNELISKVR